MELNKRIGAILLFFILFFVQSFQVITGKRDSIDVTFPTYSQESEVRFDEHYLTSRSTTTVRTTTQPHTSEGYIPKGSDEDIWSKSFGGSGSDIIRSSCFCSNADYIVCGNSDSEDFSDIETDGYALPYAFVARYSSNGKLKWINSIAGNNICVAYDVTELTDGSIVCVGYTLATNLISPKKASSEVIDAFIYRYSADGEILNKYVAEGSGYDYFYCVDATPDGGYVAGGSSTSHDGSFNMSSQGAVIFRFNSSNVITAEKKLCGISGGTVFDISVDANSTIFASCITASSDDDYAQFDGLGAGGSDSVILKYSSDLTELKWGVVIASTGNERFEHIAADNNGGCVTAGWFETKNNTGVTNGFFAGYPCYGKSDGYAIKINSNGVVTGRRSFGGSENDYITGVYKAGSDYVFSGYTKSSDFNFATLGNIGGYDAFVSIIGSSDFDGSAVSMHIIAGTGDDMAFTVCGSANETVVVGTTSSTDEFFWTTDPMVEYESTGFAVKYSIVTN